MAKNGTIILTAALVLAVSALLPARGASAVVYGPDLGDSPLRCEVDVPFYVLTTDEPDPMNVFEWHDAAPYAGGFDSGINSAQPYPPNQTFLSPPIPLGFDFPFFGQTFDTVQISLNGWFAFGSNLPVGDPAYALPTPTAMDEHPQNWVVAPYWTGFVQTLQNGAVYCRYLKADDLNAFIIQWHDLQKVAGDLDTSAFFQCLLFEDGRMKFQYYWMGDRCNGSNAVVGLKAGGRFIEFSAFDPVIHDGLAVEFTPSLTPPPFVKKTDAVSFPLPVYPSSHGDLVIGQFYVEPRLNEGTLEALRFRLLGSKGTAHPPQQFFIYLVRDTDGNGVWDEGEPVVSGFDQQGGPFLWDPWQRDDTVDVRLYDSPDTPDADNAVSHADGRKYYLVAARFDHLIMGDEYELQVTGILSDDLGISPEFPLSSQIAKLRVELADFPMAYGPALNPPLPSFDVEPDDTGVAVLSFMVRSAPEYDARIASFMVVRYGTAPGNGIRLRFFVDRGARGVYEPGVDIPVTAGTPGSSVPAGEGWPLGSGEISEVLEIPLVVPPEGEPESSSPLFLAAGGESVDILAVCDLSLTSESDGTDFMVKLVGLTYTGDRSGLVDLTRWGVNGSVVTILAARNVLRMDAAPGWEPDPLEGFAPGARDVVIASFAAYPSSRSGRLESLRLRLEGTGDDSLDIESLRVYHDTNADGEPDSGDWLLFSGAFHSDNPEFSFSLPPGLGSFYPWQGGTAADFAALNRFVVVADFSPDVEAGRNFRVACVSFSFALSDGGPVLSLDGGWIGPTFAAVEHEPPCFSLLSSEMDGITLHVSAGGAVRIGCFPLYSGSASVVVESVGVSFPAAAWAVVSSLTVFADANHDGLPQGEEVLYSRTFQPGESPADYGTLFLPLGALEVTAGSTTTLSVAASFRASPQGLDAFSMTLERVRYAALAGEGKVWFSPLAPSRRGAAVLVVEAGGVGSLAFGGGAALAAGVPSFTSGGEVKLNLARFFCGTVETLKVRRLRYTWTGDLSPGGEVSTFSVVLDDGDGVYEPDCDTILDGELSMDPAARTLDFRPRDLLLFPGASGYFLLRARISPDAPRGSWFRVDLDAAACEAAGVVFDGGEAEERTEGDPPSIYGGKVQGAAVYVGNPQADGGGEGGDEGGDPFAGGGGGGGGGGCFVATACFGSASAAEVVRLCAFRDRALAASASSGPLVSAYYVLSPAVARGASPSFRALMRAVINPLAGE